VTREITGPEAAEAIGRRFPNAVVEIAPRWVVVDPQSLAAIAAFLRDDAEMDCKYLVSVTGVDLIDRFEVVYHIASLTRNHMLVLKARPPDRENPEVPSVSSVWRGANLQECEVYDLMGIRFNGHPDLRRILLWEGYAGHPLRKDFLNLPGGFKPGLPRFPGLKAEV
jgi:NADH-quinone oxidoreductase subunit C